MIYPELFKYCPMCGRKITPFRDTLSLKEFRISGMCQKCMDKTFKENL